MSKKYDTLEIARVIGEPRDPRKSYPDLVKLICEVDTADPDEYVYYYDVLEDTDKVYTITSGGSVTSSNVSPDTPTLFNFVDVASPEYYVKLTDLMKAKERVLARKKQTINRALNGYEINYLISLMATACNSSGNQVSLGSSETSFQIDHLVEMVDKVKDYGDGYVLLVSSTIEQDIILWNWTHDKNIDVFQTFDKLNVKIVRIPNTTVTIDNSSTSLITSTKAYLVATNSNAAVGKNPLLFVRKRLNDIELLGGVISEKGDKPERLVLVSPNPMNVGGTRYLAVGLTGYEEIVAAVTNPKAIVEFTRA